MSSCSAYVLCRVIVDGLWSGTCDTVHTPRLAAAAVCRSAHQHLYSARLKRSAGLPFTGERERHGDHFHAHAQPQQQQQRDPGGDSRGAHNHAPDQPGRADALGRRIGHAWHPGRHRRHPRRRHQSGRQRRPVQPGQQPNRVRHPGGHWHWQHRQPRQHYRYCRRGKDRGAADRRGADADGGVGGEPARRKQHGYKYRLADQRQDRRRRRRELGGCRAAAAAGDCLRACAAWVRVVSMLLESERRYASWR